MITLPNKLTFNIKEVADIFGVCSKTIRNWIANGTLAGGKVGGVIRIKREDIEKKLK